MTESKKRRVHPPEFKAKVGLEALGGMKTINQIAQEHGVHPIQVGQWKREIQAQANVTLKAQIWEAFVASDETYGKPRIRAELLDAGIVASRKRMAALIRQGHMRGVSRLATQRHSHRMKGIRILIPDM